MDTFIKIFLDSQNYVSFKKIIIENESALLNKLWIYSFDNV